MGITVTEGNTKLSSWRVARSVRRKTVAAHSVCSPPPLWSPCGEELGVGAGVILLGMSSSMHAVVSRYLRLG